MVLALARRHAARSDFPDRDGENRIAAHQQPSRLLVFGFRHRIAAVSTTDDRISMNPGSTLVAAAVSVRIDIIGRGTIGSDLVS
jgi:hypothetical protein